MRSRTEILSTLDDVSEGLDATVFDNTAKFTRVRLGDSWDKVLLIEVTHKPTGLKVKRTVHQFELDLCVSLRALLTWEVEVIMNAFREKRVVV